MQDGILLCTTTNSDSLILLYTFPCVCIGERARERMDRWMEKKETFGVPFYKLTHFCHFGRFLTFLPPAAFRTKVSDFIFSFYFLQSPHSTSSSPSLYARHHRHRAGGGDYSLPRNKQVLHQMPTSATTAPSPCRTLPVPPEPVYSKIDPLKKRANNGRSTANNDHNSVVDVEEEIDNEAKSWMPLLISRRQQESTL